MSQSQARLIAQYQYLIFFDGKFKVTPSLYYQLCPFHIYVKQYKTTILGALILLTGKSKEHYVFAFNSIKNIVSNYTIRNIPYSPKNFMIDKEDAICSSNKTIWPNAEIKLCYFHFGQNILKRVNNNYFKNLIRNKISIEKIVYGSKALALIPHEVVIPIWEELKKKSITIAEPILNEYVQYFDKEWIIATEISYWNFYKDFLNRTNNYSESFNHKINDLFKNKKAKLY